MVDESMPSGVEGTITYVDGLGTLHVDWDNGRSLGLIPRRDRWVVLAPERIPEDDANSIVGMDLPSLRREIRRLEKLDLPHTPQGAMLRGLYLGMHIGVRDERLRNHRDELRRIREGT